MRRIETNKMVIGLLAFAMLGAVTGCQRSLYDPEAAANRLPSKDNYFDFKLTGDVQLTVNYDVPGLKTVIEVYDQNPMQDHKTKKEGLTPIYMAYTNDGKYDGIMNIPTAVKEAYVYAHSISAATCVKLNASDKGYTYDATASVETRGATKFPYPQYVVGIMNKDQFPYEVAQTTRDGGKRKDNLYSITAWNPQGLECVNMNYYTTPKTIGAAGEKIGDVSTRLQNFLEAQRQIDGNKSLLRDPKQINLKVPLDATDGMEVNVTFVGERASFFNTFGYYYYKDKGAVLTPEEFFKIKKYVMISNVEVNNNFLSPMVAGETVKLLYFDEENKPSDKFPAGYTIGWFVISNGFGSFEPGAGEGGTTNGGVIREIPQKHYVPGGNYSANRHTCMSDDVDGDRRFVSLYDVKSELRVIGIEDGVTHQTTPDDYMDVMFVVQTSIDLGGGDLPSVDPEDPKPEKPVFPVKGTLAFEDIWPYGGDYDLNDVIIEYKREIVFGDDNKAVKTVDRFKPVQKAGSAVFDNFFACQYKNFGTLTNVEGVIHESATNSVVVESSVKTLDGGEFVITRDLTGLNLDQTTVKKDFNPYIIARKYAETKRIEIHLPTFDMTSAADEMMMDGSNAYYIDKDGIFPFAIDIPTINFVPAGERVRIDQDYPAFKTWAESKGTEAEDWYKKKVNKEAQ